MEWQIEPPARVSSLNGQPFEPGQRVVTLLFLDEKGQLQRFDLHEGEPWEELLRSGTRELGRWVRLIKEPGKGREAARAALQTTEELFLGLFGLAAPSAGGEESGEVSGLPPAGAEAREFSGQGEVPVSGRSEPEPGNLAALKHLLALQLERKRVLRPLGKRALEGFQDYRHARSGQVVPVPVVPLDPRTVAHIQTTLGDLMA